MRIGTVGSSEAIMLVGLAFKIKNGKMGARQKENPLTSPISSLELMPRSDVGAIEEGKG